MSSGEPILSTPVNLPLKGRVDIQAKKIVPMYQQAMFLDEKPCEETFLTMLIETSIDRHFEPVQILQDFNEIGVNADISHWEDSQTQLKEIIGAIEAHSK